MYKVICFIICLFAVNTYAQKSISGKKIKTSQDSIAVFYNKLLATVKGGYVYRKDVNWNEIETKITKNIQQYQNFESSLKEVATLLDYIKADHSKVYYNKVFYSGNFPVPGIKDFTEQWAAKYKSKPAFEVKVLDNEIGYILMPGIMTQDLSSKNIHNIAQPKYDEIYKIKSSNNIKGWIIDLRFNTGGNCQPMLLALYDFLGNNKIWGMLNHDKKQISSVKLLDGKYIDSSEKISYVTAKGELLENARVAVITNLATGSSGEVTALAFKGRQNTVFIGEKTNGKTTSNIVSDLPFGAYIVLSTGLDCDRNGNFYPQIVPDFIVSGQDNFDDLLSDGNIKEAIRYINSKS